MTTIMDWLIGSPLFMAVSPAYFKLSYFVVDQFHVVDYLLDLIRFQHVILLRFVVERLLYHVSEYDFVELITNSIT
jgi:hypothetical protein